VGCTLRPLLTPKGPHPKVRLLLPLPPSASKVELSTQGQHCKARVDNAQHVVVFKIKVGARAA
jgi:hypothetical protein